MRPRRESRPAWRDATASVEDALIELASLPPPRGRGRFWARLARSRDRRLLRAAHRANHYLYGEATCLDCDWFILGTSAPALAQREWRRHARRTGHTVLPPCPTWGHHRWNRHHEILIDGQPDTENRTRTYHETQAMRAAGHIITSHVPRAVCMFCGKPHPRPSVFNNVPRGLGMGVA